MARPNGFPKPTRQERSTERASPVGRLNAFRIAVSGRGVANAGGEAVILCPWLRGLDEKDGLFLSVLPVHDCNAFVDGDWTPDIATALDERCYVGVFALDRLRQTDKLLAQLRGKGVSRLINLPTVSFFDDATARAFAALGFTIEAEIAFLDHARRNGFGVALCAPSGAAMPISRDLAFDFVLRHQGPGRPLIFESAEAS